MVPYPLSSNGSPPKWLSRGATAETIARERDRSRRTSSFTRGVRLVYHRGGRRSERCISSPSSHRSESAGAFAAPRVHPVLTEMKSFRASSNATVSTSPPKRKRGRCHGCSSLSRLHRSEGAAGCYGVQQSVTPPPKWGRSGLPRVRKKKEKKAPPHKSSPKRAQTRRLFHPRHTFHLHTERAGERASGEPRTRPQSA